MADKGGSVRTTSDEAVRALRRYPGLSTFGISRVLSITPREASGIAGSLVRTKLAEHTDTGAYFLTAAGRRLARNLD